MQNQIIIKMTKYVLVVMFILGFGCSIFEDDEELSMQCREYMGNKLRTDGYYYYFWFDGMNQEYINVCCFYQNGIFRWCGSSTSFQDFENNIDIINKSKQYKNRWGVFLIENNVVKYEKWDGARALEPYRTRIYAGKILNDTTFHITESYRPNGKERSIKDEIYHFRQFSPKPDSTNIYIK